ncbi:MAG: hypothetical protein UU34_C0009G0019 [Candidatus Curtissbacteria bacterium GW2011_GWA1_41_11]|uniref:Membrane protein 6-pyruvoyl-tetrahydropterin synthase-related domain-containing protein n=1 Tax=Candidatus Curtissbacteria bacterium GW2011_GWA1_41_11 TaxID=1618409 RepID=A0A0G0UH59_9BACT|nr:MAG: hypothetical protein UU34_C0009G0019 [Candidatus Curtissbacteria bacterium GW2011_GWA1_41_11]
MKLRQLELLSSSIFLLFFTILIVYLNFSLVRFLFEGQFNQNLASIEISYIQMAKFWVEGGGLWQPLWYLGYPWHVFYTPLLPFLEVILHNFLGFDFGQAYRVITAVAYSLVPISLYLFVWQITKSKTGAMVASLFYSFVPSIIAFIFPEVANDTLSGIFEPRRFTILVRWGEGPHTLALVFLPLFGAFLSKYFENAKFVYLLASSIFLGLIFLTNALVVWASLLLFLALVLSELCKPSAEAIKLIKNSLKIGLLTFGLIAFWYNLPFTTTFFAEGGGAFNNWLGMFPWGTLLLILVAVAVFFAVKKLASKVTGCTFAVFWFFMLFAFVYIYYASGEERLEFVPQVLRLNTEVDLALAVLVGVVVSSIFLFLNSQKSSLKIPAQIIGFTIIAFLVGALVFLGDKYAKVLPEFTKGLSESSVQSIENSAEFRTAKKLEGLVGGDQRVFVPGNYAFWLNYFVPISQIRGALFQSSVHFWPEHAYYQITNGSDANISLAWLKIANIGKLVYTTFASFEPYKDYKVGEGKFNSVLDEIGRENGDIYFDVPLKNDSLAKIVDYETLKAIKKPENAIDEQPIFAYVAELEKHAERRLEVDKITNSHLRISGEIDDGEAVLVQQTYDSGWDVKDSGWDVKRDSFDFILLIPKNAGDFEIDLVYGKPFSVYLGYLISLGTIGWVVFRFRKTKIVKAGFEHVTN